MTEFLTVNQLQEILPKNKYIQDWYDSLAKFLPDYEIDNKRRVAAFIAQCSVESGQFIRLRENLNYRWDRLRVVFPKYFATDAIAQNYAAKPNKQEAIANRVYGGRMGNGPESSGDGWRYCGRGLIQLTGKDNYTAFANSIDMDLAEVPEYLESFDGAIHSACWYWDINNLNRWVDANDFDGLCDSINIGRKTQRVGDAHGYQERLNEYNKILRILG